MIDIVEDRGYWNSAKQCELAAHVESLQATVQELEDENKHLADKCNLQAAEIERISNINSELCRKSNWYVIENARFEEKLTDSQHKVKALTDALEHVLPSINDIADVLVARKALATVKGE